MLLLVYAALLPGMGSRDVADQPTAACRRDPGWAADAEKGTVAPSEKTGCAATPSGWSLPLLSVQCDLRCARLHMLLLFAIKSTTRAFPDLGRPRSRVPCPSGWLIDCPAFGWLFALSCANVGTRRAHSELRSAAAASDVQWDMNGRRLAQWHVLQPQEAAPGRLLEARTAWRGALHSDTSLRWQATNCNQCQ